MVWVTRLLLGRGVRILRQGYLLNSTSVYMLWGLMLRHGTDKRTKRTRCAIGGGFVPFGQIQRFCGPFGIQPFLQIQAQPRVAITHYGGPYMLGSVE